MNRYNLAEVQPGDIVVMKADLGVNQEVRAQRMKVLRVWPAVGLVHTVVLSGPAKGSTYDVPLYEIKHITKKVEV